MGNETIYRLPTYPSTSARKSLSPTQLVTINQTISSALLQTIALPPSKRDSPAARAFVASYAKDTALQTLQSLIWQSGSTSKDDRVIRKRTLILAEKIAPVLDTQILLDLAIVYAQTNESRIKTIFQEALGSNQALVESVKADLVPAATHLFNPSQGLYAIRKATHCVVSFLRASPPEIVRCFSHNQVFVLALGTLYDQGLGSIAQSYGGLSVIRNPSSISSTVDEWEPIWVQAKVDLIDAFHIIITSLVNDISTASGRALAVESERTFSIIFSLLELPSSSFTVSSTPPTPFFNRSLLSDYQESYSLSKTLSIALRNAAEKDARLDLLESTLQSLESSPLNQSKKRKDAGVLKILIGSSGIAPGIDNRGDGGRVRSTQSSVDPVRIGKGKDKAAQPTGVASSSGAASSVLDIDIKITQVLDIFPDHAPNYIRALLGHAAFGGDPEKVVMALLDGSAPSPQELESEATAASISRTDDVARFVNERKNVFDDEVMDVSKLRIGKAKGDASNVLRDKSFIEEMKADILRRAETVSDDEEEENALTSSKPTGIDYAFDEDEDAGASGIKVAGDGEESGSSDAGDDNSDDAERPSKALDTETILELAYIKDPKLFDRDGQTRRSKARADLKAQTKWTDEQIEGWRIMLERNPRKDKILQKHEFAGNRHQTPVFAITSGPSEGGRDGASGGRGRGGTGRRGGGRGGGSVRGGADSARERAWKDKNKATHANHNRKKGHDKKMARAGAGVP